MSHGTGGRTYRPGRLRRAAAEVAGLGFDAQLDRREVEQVLEAHHVCWRGAVFTPLITIYAFLGQVLATDRSCRAAVARVLAWLIGHGQAACSANTGGYCQARGRLPQAVPRTLMQQIGRRLHDTHGTDGIQGLLGGRPIKLVDGSTASMPDPRKWTTRSHFKH